MADGDKQGITHYQSAYSAQLPYDARAMFAPTIIGEKPSGYRFMDPTAIFLQEPLKTPVTEAQAAALREDMGRAKVNFHDYNFHLSGDQ